MSEAERIDETKRVGENKRVVVENYPAEKLPEEIRQNIEPSHKVRVIVEDEPEGHWAALRRRVEEYHRENPGSEVTVEEAVARIRALRDEWD